MNMKWTMKNKRIYFNVDDLSDATSFFFLKITDYWIKNVNNV